MRRVIVNADDFGDSEQINHAIRRAHCEGILTSTSLMVAGSAFTQAVEIARQLPTLGVGLHLVVTESPALLPPRELSQITDASGRLSADLFRVGLRYAFSTSAQQQLRREIQAQFARFSETGLPWSHVDGHQHFHMHPFVWNTLLECCQQYGVTAIRLPREELRAHWRSGGIRPDLNVAALLIFRLLGKRHRRQLPPGMFVCDRVYGHLQTGNMTSAYLLNLIPRLTGATNEVYFHPGAAHARPLAPELQRDGIHDVELATLLDARVRIALQQADVTPSNYSECVIENRRELS